MAVTESIPDVTEQTRLNEAREKGIPWKKWGPYLSERQWGTVREDYSQDGNAWDYFTHDQARSRAYRWGEDGIAGISDDQQRLCFCLSLWNGRDPILKERLFGLTNSRGQPRRGREGVLLLRRLDAHALVHAVPVQVPAGGVPVRASSSRRTSAARARTWSTSSSTPASSTATGTSTCRSSTRRTARRICSCASPCTTAGRRPRARAPADAVVPQHVVLGTAASRSRCARARRAAPSARRTTSSATHTLSCDGAPRAPLHGEREQPRAPLRRAERLAVREGRVPPLRRLRREGRREPGEDRHEGRRRTRSTCPPAAPSRSACGCLRAPPRSPSARPSTTPSPRASPTPTSSTSASRRTSLTDDERRVHRQALAGMLWSQAVLPLRRGHLAQGARRAPARRQAVTQGAQRRVVPHVQRRRHLHAGQVGVPLVRGVGSRVPHASRSRSSTSTSPRSSSLLMLREPVRAPERPDPRLRVELQRREPAGARLGHALPLQVRARSRPRGHQVLGALVPGAASQLQLVGQPQGSAGSQRLRRRLPRPRQHRRVRSELAAPHRGQPGAGRRHRVDGLLLSEHDRDRADPRRPRCGVRGARVQLRAALPVDRLRDGSHRRQPRRDVGREGRLLLRRAPPAGRLGAAPEGALHGGPAPSVSRRRPSTRRR